VVLKTATSGYDGRGQTVLENSSQLEIFLSNLKEDIDHVVEEYVELRAEISVLVVRDRSGALATFPVSENQHRANILHRTYVPARLPDSVQAKARQLACSVADSFGLVGLLCVEMFLTKNDEVIVNELAPRPHNSGHYSLDACSISQFEALVRALCGLSVPEPKLLSPCAMVNLLGKHLERLDPARLMSIPGTKLHIYGKKRSEPKRKMGHVTILRDTMQQVEETTRLVAAMIGEVDEMPVRKEKERV
jgi:5-(carboxyamino)imidazole ribonucleotide synthase